METQFLGNKVYTAALLQFIKAQLHVFKNKQMLLCDKSTQQSNICSGGAVKVSAREARTPVAVAVHPNITLLHYTGNTTI